MSTASEGRFVVSLWQTFISKKYRLNSVGITISEIEGMLDVKCHCDNHIA